MSINPVFKVVAVLSPHIKKQTTLSTALARLTLAIFLGLIAIVGLIFLFSVSTKNTNAAPPPIPLTAIVTDTLSITHTTATTHQMRVFANGTISDQFLNENGRNQIDQEAPFGDATTIAILFDQHEYVANTLDVGLLGDFAPSTQITLSTGIDATPGYAEDTAVTYTSNTLSYQITQRTLATTTNNCVVMELSVRNTYTDSLTGGKLLFMVDIDVAESPMGDLGAFVLSNQLAYLKDYNVVGYSMGISLLEGDLRGYGIVDQFDPSFPTNEQELKNELITPTNTITNGNNNVIWLIANIPDLAPNQEDILAFGMCANTVAGGPEAEDEAAGKLEETFNKLANLSILKTSTPSAGAAVIAGQPITYTITISNTGERYVSNIVVTDTIPVATNLITYATSQGSITANNGTITATIGQLYPASNTVTITVVTSLSTSATDAQIISNQAFVNSQPIITQTNVVTHSVKVHVPVLNITKSATPQPVMAGERLTYTIVISNSGQATATNAVISDTLPANTTFVENSIQLNPPIAGTKGTEPPALVTGATINPGQTITVTFAVTVNNGLPVNTIITNTAAVTSAQTPTPNTDTITSTTTGFNLAINKFSSPPSAVPGETITYTVTVSNLETTTVTGAVVSDTLPPEIENPTWVCTGINGAACASPTGSGNLNETVDMPPGGQITYIITGQLVASATGTIVNQASVALPFGAELDPTNNVTTDTNTVAPKADLSISKYDTLDPVSAGTPVTYTLHVTNNGPSLATGLTVFDNLPAGFIFDNAIGNGWSCGNLSNLITCTTSSLSVGSISIITITATAPVTGGVYTNLASVIGLQDLDDSNNFSSITTTVIAQFDLAISKSVNPNTLLVPGQALTYTLVYTNKGPNTAKNVRITDTIPAILTNVTYSNSGAAITPIGGNTYVWRVDENLAPGAEGIITVNGIISPQLQTDTIFTNTAIITADLSGTNIETGPAPNTSTVTSTVSLPRVSISKQSSATTVHPGERITYTIIVSNSGDVDATGAIIRDNLPDNTTYIPGSIQLVPSGLGTTGSPPLLVSNLTVPAGQQITATFAVTVSRPLTDGTIITNTATITSEQNLTPILDTVTTTVVAPPAVEIAKTGLSQVDFGDTAVFTFTVTNAGDSLLQITDLVDDYATPIIEVGGDTNGNGWLDLDESWIYTGAYTVQINDPTPLVNTAHVTAVDGIGTETSDSDTHSTTIAFNPVLAITKDGPPAANVGDTLIFTFTIEHASGSDGSPIHDVLVADDYAGLATLVSNGNGDNLLDFGEQWIYTASYTTKPTNPNPLINTGTVIGRDRQNEPVSATATHSTALVGYEPVLFVDKQGPTEARIGETVEYTFIVVNYANVNTLALFGLDFLGVLNLDPGDGSPINMSVVTDTVAGTASYVSGDYNGNNMLDAAEAWTYTATHTITVTDPDPLVNMVFANGTDQDGDNVIASDTHTTDVLHVPQIEISRTGPISATVGQTVNFTYTVSHNGSGDGTPVRNLTVNDSVAGNTVVIGGDTNINNMLDFTETWTYTTSYTVKLADPDPLVSIVTAQGLDEDSDPVIVTTPFSLTISDIGVKKYYFPIIFNEE